MRLTFGAETVTVNGKAIAYARRQFSDPVGALAEALAANAAPESCRIAAEEGASMSRLFWVMEPLAAKGVERCVLETAAGTVPLRCKSPGRRPNPAEMRTVKLADGREARTTAKPGETAVHLTFHADRVDVVHKRMANVLSERSLRRPLSEDTLSKAMQAEGLSAVVLHFDEKVLAEDASSDLYVVADAHAALRKARKWNDDEWLLIGP